MAEGLGNKLQRLHDLTVEGPPPEGLDLASTGSIPKHLSHLALQSAAAGQDAQQWRAAVLAEIPGVSPQVTEDAERFMREAGLWPWAFDE
jgi:hypothetical protein